MCRLSKAREQFWETCLGRVGDQLQPILGEACPGEDSYHRFFGEVFPQGEGAHIVLCMHVVVPPRVDGSSGEHLFGNVICRVSPWGFRGGGVAAANSVPDCLSFVQGPGTVLGNLSRR